VIGCHQLGHVGSRHGQTRQLLSTPRGQSFRWLRILVGLVGRVSLGHRAATGQQPRSRPQATQQQPTPHSSPGHDDSSSPSNQTQPPPPPPPPALASAPVLVSGPTPPEPSPDPTTQNPNPNQNQNQNQSHPKTRQTPRRHRPPVDQRRCRFDTRRCPQGDSEVVGRP